MVLCKTHFTLTMLQTLCLMKSSDSIHPASNLHLCLKRAETVAHDVTFVTFSSMNCAHGHTVNEAGKFA